MIFGLRNALLLEAPSSFQHHLVKSTEEGRLHMSEAEYKMLRTKNTVAAEEAMELSDVNESEGDQNAGTQAMRKTNAGGKRIGVKDTVQFKRKKAKVFFFLVSIFIPMWLLLLFYFAIRGDYT